MLENPKINDKRLSREIISSNNNNIKVKRDEDITRN